MSRQPSFSLSSSKFQPSVKKGIRIHNIYTLLLIVFVVIFSCLDPFQSSESISLSRRSLPYYGDQRKARLGDGCYHVFIDVGSNIGVHGRFLYEPDKFPKSISSVATFAEEFGTQRDNRDYCVFAFEPNPKFHERHLELKEAYAVMGWRYHPIFAGASHKEGNLTFYHSHMKDAKQETGFSAVAKFTLYGKAAESITVPVVRLSRWIKEEIQGRQIPAFPHIKHLDGAKVMMKLDVEGLEYTIFPDLLTTGVLCETVSFLLGEFHYTTKHHNIFPMNLTSDGSHILEMKEAQELSNYLTYMVQISENCLTKISLLDDESYQEDPVPFPKPVL